MEIEKKNGLEAVEINETMLQSKIILFVIKK